MTNELCKGIQSGFLLLGWVVIIIGIAMIVYGLYIFINEVLKRICNRFNNCMFYTYDISKKLKIFKKIYCKIFGHPHAKASFTHCNFANLTITPTSTVEVCNKCGEKIVRFYFLFQHSKINGFSMGYEHE